MSQLPSHNARLLMGYEPFGWQLHTDRSQSARCGQRANRLHRFIAFQREKIGVRQATYICAARQVLQVFTISRSRLILLTPETQIRIWPATSSDSGKCSCGESSPKEANEVCFLIIIFTLTNLFSRDRTFQASLIIINSQSQKQEMQHESLQKVLSCSF